MLLPPTSILWPTCGTPAGATRTSISCRPKSPPTAPCKSFRERLTANLARVRTIGDVGHPLGFTWIKGDELNQFYVAAEARGQGIAAILMADAEARMQAAGVKTAWLDCAIGNLRAARFYEKSGWQRTGTVTIDVTLTTGPRPFEVWRYEKALLR